MAKNIIFGEEARKSLQTGVDKLANAVNVANKVSKILRIFIFSSCFSCYNFFNLNRALAFNTTSNGVFHNSVLETAE